MTVSGDELHGYEDRADEEDYNRGYVKSKLETLKLRLEVEK